MKQVNIHDRTVRAAGIVESVFDGALWVTLLLVLSASFMHVAAAFNSLERGREQWIGFAAAASVDLALAAIAYVRQQRKAAGIDVGMMTFGLFFFAGISMLANVWHGLDVLMVGERLTVELLASLNLFDWIRVVALSATLPVIILYLGEIISVPGSKSLLKGLIDQAKEMQSRLKEAESRANALETDMQQTATALQDAERQLKDAKGLIKAAETRERKLKVEVQKLNTAFANMKEELEAAQEAALMVKVLGPIAREVARMKVHGNITQAEIASRYDVSPTYVSRVSSYMNGKK